MADLCHVQTHRLAFESEQILIRQDDSVPCDLMAEGDRSHFYLFLVLKQGKFIPGVKIPIKNKKVIKDSNNVMLVLAWNFYEEIKKNNSNLSNNFINIKDLENKI